MLNMGGTLFAFISWILAIVGTGWVWPEYSEGSAWAPLIGVFGFVMFILALIGESSTAESIANNTETDTRRRVIWRRHASDDSTTSCSNDEESSDPLRVIGELIADCAQKVDRTIN